MNKFLTTMALIGLFSYASNAGLVENNQELTKIATKIRDRYQNSVITVSAIVKTQMSGRGAQFGHGRERKTETPGIIIDASGLTLVPLSKLEPNHTIHIYTSDGVEKGGNSTVLSDTKMILANGDEISAKMVMKDPELDLAFLIPAPKENEEAPEKYSFLDLTKNAKDVKLMEYLITVSRLAKFLKREINVHASMVNAIIKKPRTFYIGGSGVGTPIFNLKGEIIGVRLLRKNPSSRYSRTYVILPAPDIQEIAGQALEKIKAKK